MTDTPPLVPTSWVYDENQKRSGQVKVQHALNDFWASKGALPV